MAAGIIPFLIVAPLALWQTVRGMAERNFIVLRYEGKVPAMADCEKCKRELFIRPLMLVAPVAHRNTYLASLIITLVNHPLSLALNGDSQVSVCPTHLFEWRRLYCSVQMTAKPEFSALKRCIRTEVQQLVAEFVSTVAPERVLRESRLELQHAGSRSEKALCTPRLRKRTLEPGETA
jgi:hypothetical protein